MRQLSFISLLFMLLTQASAWADVIVIVRQEAEAAGNYVRICDIARVEGPKETALEVAKTILGPTPPRGQVLEITRWEIEHRIYEMGLRASVSFTGNDVVRVSGNGSAGMELFGDAEEESGEPAGRLTEPAFARDRRTPAAPGGDEGGAEAFSRSQPEAGTGIAESSARPARPKNPLSLVSDTTRERLANAAANYIASCYKRPDVEVEAKVLALSSAVPEDARTITVEEALDGRAPGKVNLTVKVVDADGKRLPPVEILVDSEVYALAPVAAKPLYKGDVLKPRDVVVTRVKMKSGQTYLPPDSKAVEGREMQRHLTPGSPILDADARPTAMVKRGNLVVVDAAGKGWRLQANAKALGSGNLGDLIMVEDSSSKTKYQARVTGYGTVAALPKTGLNS